MLDEPDPVSFLSHSALYKYLKLDTRYVKYKTYTAGISNIKRKKRGLDKEWVRKGWKGKRIYRAKVMG